MPSSYRILKGTEKSHDCKVLEIRHSFFLAEAMEPEEICQADPGEDPARAAARIVEEAGEKAREIVSGSREAARELEQGVLREALEEAERIKKQAWDEAYAQGRKEALDMAAAEAAALREEARSVLRQAEEVRRGTLKTLEAEIVRLAIEIAEKVLAVKLKLHPQVVVDIAREAITRLHERDQVVLYVNPDEAGLYEERREELIKLIPPRGDLQIIPDPGVGPGGCLAETEHGLVDAALDTRWQALLEALGEIKP